jgi:GDP/UDP-N,N'-diacetylbacillosamine 2-epimerase (hydrolysing)
MKKKTIYIVTGSRADYGLLKNLITEINKSNKFELTLIVTGQHLSKKYGNTYKEIKNDFGKSIKFIDIKVNNSEVNSILKSISIGITKVGKYFASKKPDLLIILGDRYEMLSFAVAALFNKVIIAHIHGGELTQGSIDDTIRHTISKFSNYHFVATKPYKKRVVQLGENPKKVFLVGGLGSENVKNISYLDKKVLEKNLNIKFKKNNFLITFNSFLDDKISVKVAIRNMFKALNKFKNTNYIFTFPNSDLESNNIIKMIINFSRKNKNAYCFKSLGVQRYLSCMKICNVVVGNSSSGILEAPSLKTPTINIGNRQNGRIKAKSVIDCNYSSLGIQKAIKKALSKKFQKKIKNIKNPYYKKNTSIKIMNIIEQILKNKITIKKFYDIRF